MGLVEAARFKGGQLFVSCNTKLNHSRNSETAIPRQLITNVFSCTFPVPPPPEAVVIDWGPKDDLSFAPTERMRRKERRPAGTQDRNFIQISAKALVSA